MRFLISSFFSEYFWAGFLFAEIFRSFVRNRRKKNLSFFRFGDFYDWKRHYDRTDLIFLSHLKEIDQWPKNRFWDESIVEERSRVHCLSYRSGFCPSESLVNLKRRECLLYVIASGYNIRSFSDYHRNPSSCRLRRNLDIAWMHRQTSHCYQQHSSTFCKTHKQATETWEALNRNTSANFWKSAFWFSYFVHISSKWLFFP